MSDFNIPQRGSNAANRLTPEQKLERVARAFLTYKLLQIRIDHLEVDRFEMEHYETDSAHTKWQNRIGTLYMRRATVGRYIERLTAPAEPAPMPEAEAKSDYNWTFPVRPSSTPSNWPCVVCGELSVTDRENRPVCDEHRAMLDCGAFTMDELLYDDDDMADGE